MAASTESPRPSNPRATLAASMTEPMAYLPRGITLFAPAIIAEALS